MPARFSDRIGATRPTEVLLLNSLSVELRNSLWNWLLLDALDAFSYAPAAHFYSDFLKRPIDELDATVSNYKRKETIKHWFINADWYDIYNAIEHVLTTPKYRISGSSERKLNEILEREMSGYRWIGGVIAAITTPSELESVSDALRPTSKVNSSAKHIAEALALLSKRPQPDYRNSIKESISAVEAAAVFACGDASPGIEKAVAILEKRGTLHGAFKSALVKLYGWTSDGGIRHAVIDQREPTFDEAKFMLVVCSAFVNLLLSAGQ